MVDLVGELKIKISEEVSPPPGMCGRGTEEHPLLCWRIDNVDKTEKALHKSNYDPIEMSSPKIKNQYGNALEEIKKSIFGSGR
ncbi:MAG: hypothetical protein HQK54_15115 [Oligoflexales bacterium]|nr:hypothetical protein [Oligoflexales bacterium]